MIGGYHMVVGVEEVGVIGKPTEAKHDQHNNEHLGQLKIYYCESTYRIICYFETFLNVTA